MPLAIINAAAWSAIVLYVEQQRQQQYAMTNYLSAFLGPLACPSLLLGSSGGVPVAALAGVRLAVTTLVSIALVSSTRRRNGGSRSSRAAHMLPGEFRFLVQIMCTVQAQPVGVICTQTLLLRSSQGARIPVDRTYILASCCVCCATS